MRYDYIPPPVPTLRRWLRLRRDLSALRMLEYERLERLALPGRVLDYGGGAGARYNPLLRTDGPVESVNIDPAIGPTHLIAPGDPIPVEDGRYDAAICLNTLEHVYDAPAVLRELHRVTRPGGEVHVMVPFMFRIHGHPDDYLRATPSWWRETFRRVGFASLALEPLVWGRGATRSLVPGLHGALPRTRMHAAMLADILSARLQFPGGRIDGRRGERLCATSPGWSMTGRVGGGVA